MAKKCECKIFKMWVKHDPDISSNQSERFPEWNIEVGGNHEHRINYCPFCGGSV
jgi:hypothetical protein